MRYVSRDARGEICAVYAEPREGAREALSEDHPDLRAFLGVVQPGEALQASDLALVRVIEDLVGVLVDKGVILFTELPPAAQDKLLERGRLRRALAAPTVVDEDDLV
jgi:hypothetical protein